MTDIIDIQVRDNGTPVVERNLRNVGSAARDGAAGVDLLNSAMIALGSVLAVDKVMQWADAWNSAEGLIRTSTKSTEEAAAVINAVYDAAQKTRVPLREMADLYTSTARAGAELGASQADVIRFSEGVGKALAIQHTTANQARGALIQLGQALYMGKIRSQEYNSLLQNGQVILQTVAKGMYGAAGSVAQLTREAKGGKLTSKEFFDAFLKGSADLDEKFAKTSFLFSQAFVVLENGVSKYVGQMDAAVGGSTMFVNFVKWAVDNLPILAGLFLGLGTAIAIALAPVVITKFMAGLQALWALLMLNPFVALLGAIAGVVVALTLMRDSIKLGIDDTTTLGDLMRAIWEDVIGLFQTVAGAVSDLWALMTTDSQTASTAMSGNMSKATDSMIQDFHDFYADTGSGLAGVLTAIAKTADAIVGLLGAAALTVKDVFLGFFSWIANEFLKAGNAAAEFSETFVNHMIDASNKVREVVGLDPLAHVQFKKSEVEGADKFRSLGEVWRDNLDAAFQTTDAIGLNHYLQDKLKQAQEIGKKRTASGPAPDLSGPIGGTGNTPDVLDPKAARALERLKNALANVIGEISPAENALKKLAQAQEVLTAAVKAHLITQAQADDIMGKLKQKYEDIIHPLAAMNKEIDHNIALSKLSNREAQVESELYQRLNELKQKGAYLTAAETAALRAKIVVEQEMDRIAQARDSMHNDSSAGKMEEFTTQLAALKQLMADPSTFGAGDQFAQVQKMLPWADLSKTKEQQAAYVQTWHDMYDQVNALEQAGVINHQTAEMAKAQADAFYAQQRIQGQRDFYSSLSGLMASSNKKLFAIGKAAAITTAVIDGVSAVQKAYAGSPYPYNIAAAIAQGVIAAANVAKIAAQQPPGFRTGGSMIVGGSGGDDSQMVSFRATPGERVSVHTPSQARALERGTSSAPPVVQVKAINVFDPSIVGEFMATPEGEDVFINRMERAGFQRKS